MREEKRQKQKCGKKRKRIMKKALFIAAICALIMATGCEGLFADKNENSRENSQGNNGGGGEAGGKEGENGLPDDAVSGWKMTSFNGNSVNYTQVFTFKYDDKGRFCGYDEKYTGKNGSTSNYTRSYNWVSDDKVKFGNEEWTFTDGKATKYHDSVQNDDSRPDTWTFTYDPDGKLKSAAGAFENYLDGYDLSSHKNWNKQTDFSWSGGNITMTQEKWSDGKGASLSRNKKLYSYGTRDNPFYGHTVDPISHLLFDRLWCGFLGPNPKKMLTKISFEDRDFHEDGGAMEYNYLYDIDGNLREIIVNVMEGQYVLVKYNYHLYYAGIPDAEPFNGIN